MKTLLTILAIAVFSCGKEDERMMQPAPQNIMIPASFYGVYDATQTCNTGNYVRDIKIIPFTAYSVKWFYTNGWANSDTMVMNVTGNTLTIPSQTFPNTNWQGGTYTVTGSGFYSGNQITFTESTAYMNAVQNSITNCMVSGMKQ